MRYDISMLGEILDGKHPTAYHDNRPVKTIIMSESLVWSAWNFITPIFALFAATQIPGGNIQIAATSYSVYLLTRVVFTLISGQYLRHKSEIKLFTTLMYGIAFVSIGYIGFAVTSTIFAVYFYYAIIGVGLGLASPAKNSLLANHVNREKETFEYGLMDASVFISMALAAALGGFIAHEYGFRLVFILAAILNSLGALTYLIYIRSLRRALIKFE